MNQENIKNKGSNPVYGYDKNTFFLLFQYFFSVWRKRRTFGTSAFFRNLFFTFFFKQLFFSFEQIFDKCN